MRLVAQLDNQLLKRREPIPGDELATLEQRANELSESGDEAGARYLSHVMTYYRVENAWRSEGSEPGERLAELLGGEVATSGELRGKDAPQQLGMSARKGNCYVVLSHMKHVAGEDDKLEWMDFEAGAANWTLQRFRVNARRTQGPGALRPLARSYTHGVCATKNTKVEVSAKLQYAGTSNALRYVVLEIPRHSFPEYVAVNLEVVRSDSCDAKNWELLWTQPIPGSLVYGGKQPYLPYDVGESRELWMTAYSASGHEARLQRRSVSSSPPSAFSFGKDLRFSGCPHTLDRAKSPDGKKVARCYEKLDRRYDPRFARARKAIRQAPNIVARANAQQRLERLNARYDQEAKPCKRLEERAMDKMQAVYSRLIDLYASDPPQPRLDRATEMRLQYEGSH